MEFSQRGPHPPSAKFDPRNRATGEVLAAFTAMLLCLSTMVAPAIDVRAQPAADTGASGSASPAHSPSRSPPEAPPEPPAQASPDANRTAPLAVSEAPRTAVNLPRDLSPWSMFMSADVLVQAVMLGLAFASVVTWTVWLAKIMELKMAMRKLRVQILAFADQRSLAEAAQHLPPDRGIMQAFVRAAEAELELSSDLTDKTGIKERIGTRLQRLETAATRNMHKGTGLLATIGATAPFVGLFGTVWGIMNSFIGISKAQTTNLAVVAPGIAEALLATAMGLFAAIPAVIIYNFFARWIGSYRALVGDASADVLRLVSRELDRRDVALDDAIPRRRLDIAEGGVYRPAPPRHR
jgi:biopolymer transport protein ExbB